MRLRSFVQCAVLAVIAGAVGGPAIAGPSTDGAAPVAQADDAYALPLAGPLTVLRGFDPPPQPWLAGHRGVDLAAVPNGDVLAPAAGVVTFAGRVADRPVVTITHPDGRRSSLEPVAPDVARGDEVRAGEVIGSVSPHGSHCERTCVHWGVRIGTFDPPRYVDPLALVGMAAPIVLLPDP